MTDVAHSEAPVGFKDRSLGLIIYGVVELAVAALIGLFAMLSFAGWLLMRGQASDVPGMDYPLGMMIGGAAMYILLAVFFAVVGVGSFLARRWACAVMLAASWTWLVIGVVSFIIWLLVLPRFEALMVGSIAVAPAAAPPPGFQTTFVVITTIFSAILYIVMPLAFLLFYRSPHVQATCAWRDPTPRWTDRCALPVLATVLLFGAGGAFAFVGVSYGFFPVFGRIVTGAVSVLGWVAMGALSLLAAWRLSRLSPIAWWGVTLLSLGFGLSWVVTLWRIGFEGLYSAMGMPAQEVELMTSSGLLDNDVLATYSTVILVAWFAYLLWVRRFLPARERAEAQPAGVP